MDLKEQKTYDPFSITLEKSKHFVVRFIKWPHYSIYPVGYVSEEIKPKDFDHYYSLLHDVPSEAHKYVFLFVFTCRTLHLVEL